MRWRGVSHVEFAVLDYDDSVRFSGVGAESAVTTPGLAVLPRHSRVRESLAGPGAHGSGRDPAGDAHATRAAVTADTDATSSSGLNDHRFSSRVMASSIAATNPRSSVSVVMNGGLS